MNYSFEYIDIILLAMIAGFIFYAGKLINNGELEINNFFSIEESFLNLELFFKNFRTAVFGLFFL